MKLVIPKGSTSRIITVFIQDSTSTAGAGLGSLIHTSSISGGYVREGGTGVALSVNEDVATEGTYQAPTTAAQVRIGTPANMVSGTYELHFHNDLFATGAEALTITLSGATNMAPLTIEVQLSDPVRGLGAPTALPNAAADAAGGLIISTAGTTDADDCLTATGFATPTNITAGTITTVTTVTNDVGVNEWNGVALSTTNPLPNAAAGAAGGLPTDSTGKTSFNDIAATAIVSAGAITTSGGAVSGVISVTNLTNAATAGDLTTLMKASVQTEVDTALASYDAVVPADLPTNFGDLAITATTGYMTLGGILGAALTETTGGRIAGNFDTFFENADAATAQTVDDVGSGGGGDATAANQTTIITHLTDVKGTSFVKDTHSLTDITADVTGINGDAMRGTDSAATAASLVTAQNDLDTITGTDGVTLATAQGNYAPATVAALATVDANVDAVLKSGFYTVENALTAVDVGQQNFTLTSGPSNDLPEGIAIFFDATDSDNPSVVDITSYTGSTGVLLTDSAPGFTVTTSDSVTLVAGITASSDVNVTQVAGQTASATGAVDFDDLATIEGLASGATGFVAIDTVVDAIKVVTDALGATAAANLALSAGNMVPGTVETATTAASTTSFAAADITEATADHYNGRIIIFTSGALQYQATSISDYVLTSGEGEFTVVALTEAPADGDTFIII